MQVTIAKKLDAEHRLGALPSNVIACETDEGDVGVSAVDPKELLSVVDDPELDEIGAEVRERFERVSASVSA